MPRRDRFAGLRYATGLGLLLVGGAALEKRRFAHIAVGLMVWIRAQPGRLPEQVAVMWVSVHSILNKVGSGLVA